MCLGGRRPSLFLVAATSLQERRTELDNRICIPETFQKHSRKRGGSQNNLIKIVEKAWKLLGI